jgi:CRISPR/Cas system CMR subunit Cmr4 (Cas7 group RAMP superfamily)
MTPAPPLGSSRRRLTALATAVALVRIGAGVALGGIPRPFLRLEQPIPPGSSMTLLMRTVGIRDLAIGLGTLRTVRAGRTDDLERWIGAGLVSDALDVAAGLAAARTMGTRGVLSAAVAAPMVILDCVTLAELTRARGAVASPED